MPYIFLVPLYVRAPNDASEPQRDEVKPTGMLGPASLNGWTMSPVRRWNRLMSPHGVFQLPKSLASLSDAVDNACSSRCGGVSAPTRPICSPQYTASDVGTDVTDHRRSQRRSSAICSDIFAFSGLSAAVSSQALSNAGIASSNAGR